MHTVCISHAEWQHAQQQRAGALGSLGGPRACGSSALVVGAGRAQDRAGKPQLARWLLHGRPDKLSLLNQQLCCSEALAESSASGRSSASQGDGSGPDSGAAGPPSAPAGSASSGGNSSGSTCSIVKRLRTSRLAGPAPGNAAGEDSACGGSQEARQRASADLVGLPDQGSQAAHAQQEQADVAALEPAAQQAPAPDAASDSRMLTRSRKRLHAMLLHQPVSDEQAEGPAPLQAPARPAPLPCMMLSPAAVRLVAAAVLDAPLPYIIGTSTPVHGWFQYCRGCGSKTARTRDIAAREVALCHDCQNKWCSMVQGEAPGHTRLQPGEEPLAAWIPAIVAPGTPLMDAAQRRGVCESILLRQDDAWAKLIGASPQ